MSAAFYIITINSYILRNRWEDFKSCCLHHVWSSLCELNAPWPHHVLRDLFIVHVLFISCLINRGRSLEVHFYKLYIEPWIPNMRQFEKYYRVHCMMPRHRGDHYGVVLWVGKIFSQIVIGRRFCLHKDEWGLLNSFSDQY